MAEQQTDEGMRGDRPRAGGDLKEELTRLGRQLAVVAKSAWESETSRNIQGEIKEGLEEVISQLDDASKKISASEETQRLRAQVERVVETAKESDISQGVREGFLSGLKELNTQLDKLLTRLSEPEDTPRDPQEPPTM
jgi:heparin binding hemagglutinin HbhA